MKNKSIRHKEFNTFKFIPFSERIQNIKIDVVHQIKHKYELETDETTYFFQAYEKWVLLNCSQCFEDLKGAITEDIRTLPQLIARKDELIEILKHHLSQGNPLNLQALLEFVVALARDLRQEFYPHFFSFYTLLTNLLNVKNAEQLEWVFQCLAYLFKFLWRYLLTNLKEVFHSLLPLFHESKPQYIRNFASQSFAFVARKIKDENKLIRLVIHSLKDKPEAIEGCSRLIFEIIRGIKGHFHSCGEKILRAFIFALKETNYPQSVLCEILSNVNSYLVGFLSLGEVSTLWKILQDSLTLFHEECKKDASERNVASVEQLLCMIQTGIRFKSCHLLTEPQSLIIQLLKLLEPGNQIKDTLTDLISQILSLILLSSKALPQELSSRIVIGAMSHLNESDLLTFAVRIMECSSFDGLVLPKLMSFCLEKSSPMKCLPYLTQLVLRKAPPPGDARQLSLWTPYSLQLPSSKKGDPLAFSKTYLEYISSRNRDGLEADFEECLQILYLLPHLLPLSKLEAASTLQKLIEYLSGLDLTEDGDSSNSTKLLYLLSVALETLIYLKPNICITKMITPGQILPTLLKYSGPEYIFILRSLDFYISVDELTEIAEHSTDIKQKIAPLLKASYEKVRLHATHILYEVEKTLGSHEMSSSVLEACWLSESIPVSLQTYRDKLRHLQKLDPSNEIYRQALTQGVVDCEIPLNCLMGVLFVNFKLLWEPVSRMIASYVSALTPTAFWEIFVKQLDDVELIIRTSTDKKNVSIDFSGEHLTNEFQRLNIYQDRPDYVNYRILLLEILQGLPEICESKNKSIVIHFLSFLEEEYRKKSPDAARTWDIRAQNVDLNETLNTSLMNVTQHNDVEMEVDLDSSSLRMNESKEEDAPGMEVEELESGAVQGGTESTLESSDTPTKTITDEELPEDDIEDIKRKFEEDKLPEEEWKTKRVTKTLLTYMALFGQCKAPKSLYKEPELYKIFFEFLSHKLTTVQKCALDYIFTYNSKHLTPCKDHLYGLLDDKNFRNELSVFSIDSQSEVVKPEHRPDLIPLVLRIVHSRMYGKLNAAKSETQQGRKAAVLRFLSGCSAVELNSFITMAFCPFTELVKDSCLDMVSEIMDSIQLEACIPPRRLVTCSSLLSVVISYCGGIMNQEQTRLLLKLLLCIASFPPAILSRRNEVHPGYSKMLKLARRTCFEALSKFFKVYEKLTWTEDETEALFKVFVWPNLGSIIEGLNSPSLLLKIFCVWSKNEKYFPLLEKKNAEGASPLSSTMDLWFSAKLHPLVHNILIDFVHDILVPEGDREEAKTDGEAGASSGLSLLSDYMPRILEVLQCRLSSKKKLTRNELSVLGVVTTSAREYISSESLLSLLLPSLLRAPKPDEMELSDILSTIGNLIIKSKGPVAYLKQLVALFSSVGAPAGRKLLLSTVLEIAKNINHPLNEELLWELNAWDPKWVEQPDFGRRLEAYSRIEKMNEKVDSILAVIIIRTSFLYLRDVKDLSVKESARHCLKTFTPKVCLDYSDSQEELSFIVDSTVLPLVKSGLEDHTEVFRFETISFLGSLVRECGTVHPMLKCFIPFSNKADLEVDFFENLIHLQLHRRVRAMLRFSEVLETMENPPVGKALMFYAMPMISQFLLSFKYSDKNSIVDSAIKTFGTICRFLPWRFYNLTFKLSLKKLRTEFSFHKQVIRMISEILNSFHFDLSQAEELPEGATPVVIKAKESQDSTNEENTLEEVDNQEEEEEATEDTGGAKTAEEEKRPAVDTLDRAATARIIHELASVILPNLQKILSEKLTSDSFHKVNRRMAYADADEDAMLRIPLGIAIVKLLQKLPSPRLLESNLPGLFLKLANFLKSRCESVRKCARSTLETIMISLGGKYLPRLVSELCALLTRGFHLHVLVYTLHGLLSRLKEHLRKGDIDPCVQQILSVCTSDLFGAVSEEKEVNSIVAKTMEAKAKRSYDLFYILGCYISENYILNLVVPLKTELSGTVSHKTLSKVSDCLSQVALGLTENQWLPPSSLLEFSYGLASDSIPSLTCRPKEQADLKQLEYQARRQPDIFIIPQAPKQEKSLVTQEYAQTNAHILVEFGLKLLHFLLKREKVNKPQFKPMLEPLVKLLLDCLNSKHVKVSTLALKCFAWVLKMDLEAVNAHIKEISAVLFEILHQYAAAGLSKGDNFDLVMAAFKAVSVLVRSVKGWKGSLEERRVLLLYCEQDIEDRERQATAFSLLKALIASGVCSSELAQVMKKVSQASITSPLDSVRLQSRQVMLNYLMEYRLGKEVLTFLSFYLNHLSYSTKTGRESALIFVGSVVSAFPQKILTAQSGVIFVNVVTRLVNEEDSGLQREAASLVVLLLQKLEQNARDKLFDVTTSWLQSNTIPNRRLGMQLVGLFVAAEKTDFARRLDEYMKLAVKEIGSGFGNRKAGRFVMIKNPEEEEDTKKYKNSTKDQLAFHTLQSLIKVFTVFPDVLKENKYSEYIDLIKDECQLMLAHEHEWVRTLAVQLLGLILTTKQIIGTKGLALDLVSQLIPSVGDQLLMQTMKLLVHLAVSVASQEENPEVEFSLPWLVRRVRHAVNKELVLSPSSTKIRTMACRWGAALSLKLNRVDLSRVGLDLLSPIVKEQASVEGHSSGELTRAAKEAAGYIKGKLGPQEYNSLVSRISQQIEAKRAQRRNERSQLAVTDPERAAKRKINKQLKKKVQKKRKVELIKSHKFKRRPKKDVDLDLE